jgi:hypothetical protein
MSKGVMKSLDTSRILSGAENRGEEVLAAHPTLSAKKGLACSLVKKEGDKVLTDFEKILAAAQSTCDKVLETASAKASDRTPAWTINRVGSQYVAYLPANLDTEDPLSAAITLLLSRCPNVAINTTVEAFETLNLTSEASKMLMGIIAAMQGPPRSYASSTSPTDLAQTSLWILASQMAVSSPDCPKDVKGIVIPEKIGSDSNRKYLTKIFSTLRTCAKDEVQRVAVHAIDTAVHIWARSQSDIALELVKSQRISWSAVLAKAGTWETKKVKGKEMKRLLIPHKPNASPWCSATESKALSDIYAGTWEEPSRLAAEWKKLDAVMQHSLFESFVKELKASFAKQQKISQTVSARLGHRKRHILSFIQAEGQMPKKKSEQTDNFRLRDIFYKLDLSKLDEKIKYQFYPSLATCVDKEEESSVMARAFALAKDWEKSLGGLDKRHPRDRMEGFWLNKFKPATPKDLVWNSANAEIETSNRFSLLPDEESS